ncbi:MAG: T9SS type A sorting domain-containing protein [Bacteroidota bacterium]
MKRIKPISLVLVLLCLGQQLFALNPHEPATLYSHLVEVNKEWNHQVPATDFLLERISFDSDNDRIRMHLMLVESYLRNRQPEGISSAQLTKRHQMLDELNAYWKAGTFPINLYHPQRQPYFIDHKGTACAVGYLMIASGYQEDAQRVHRETNYAYIREIKDPALPVWAAEHGFTLEELAWIQPGYPPTTIWNGLGSGTDGDVQAMLNDPSDNTLIVAGDFTQANGVNCQGIARWDGTTFSAIGNGVQGTIEDMTFFQGALWVGGNLLDGFSNPVNLAKWDGSTWTYSSIAVGPIYDLHVHNGELYAAGEMSGIIYIGVAKYDPNMNAWNKVGAEISGLTYSLATHKGMLYAGGDFMSGAGTDALQYVARWNGVKWEAPEGSGPSLDAPVYTLASTDTALYAGGNFFDQEGKGKFGLASWQNGSWTPNLVDTNFARIFQATENEHVRKLQVLNGKLVATGYFGTGGGLFFGKHAGVYTPGLPGLSPIVDPNGAVRSATVYKNELILAGAFTVINTGQSTGTRFNHLMRNADVLASAPRVDEGVSFTLYPNPMSDEATIRLDTRLPNQKDLAVKLYSLQGQEIDISYEQNDGQVTLYREQLTPGTYMVELSQQAQVLARGKLVVR